MIRRAMILAAGRGERLRPLTDHTPKPLIPVGGKPLIEHHIERLAAAGVTDIIINLAHLAEQIPAALGDGSRWSLRLHYSWENQHPTALETAGGIRHALPLLSDTFLLVNGDIFTDYPFAELLARPAPEAFHLVLVPNPDHHPQGDFALDNGQLRPANTGTACHTYAGIGLYQKALFADLPEGRAALGTLLKTHIAQGQGSGERFDGTWLDVGTVERLAQADQCAVARHIKITAE